MSRIAIRTIIKDILRLLKEGKEGRFELPKNEDYYDFSNLPYPLSVELVLKQNDNLKNYLIDANYLPGESIIELVIEYDKQNLMSYSYQLIGELNELIAHEMEHARQDYFDEFDLFDVKIKENNLEYYLQPHEIIAQVKGFKRISKLSGLPFFVVVKNWFDSHRDIHQLNSTEIESKGNGKKYNMIFSTENIKLIEGSYDVTISSKGISHFKHTTTPIEYWIMSETGSKYEG